LIVAKKPIEQARSIALDRSSRSTQALTRILCAEQWKIAPEVFEAAPDLSAMLERSDAALLIGDPALRVSLAVEKEQLGSRAEATICQAATLGITSAEILYVYDVVTEWRRLTGLPAVLAVWAAKHEVVTTDVAGDFMASRDFGLARISEICAEAARELELPNAAVEMYLRENIDYTLDTENRRGLERYFQEAAKLGLIAKNRTIEWAAAPSLAAQVSSTSTLS
jgi:predicted solute-binding protein